MGQVSPGFREPSQQQEEGRWTEVLWPEDPAPVAGVWGGGGARGTEPSPSGACTDPGQLVSELS